MFAFRHFISWSSWSPKSLPAKVEVTALGSGDSFRKSAASSANSAALFRGFPFHGFDCINDIKFVHFWLFEFQKLGVIKHFRLKTFFCANIWRWGETTEAFQSPGQNIRNYVKWSSWKLPKELLKDSTHREHSITLPKCSILTWAVLCPPSPPLLTLFCSFQSPSSPSRQPPPNKLKDIRWYISCLYQPASSPFCQSPPSHRHQSHDESH